MAQIKALPAELQKVAIEQLGEVPARLPDDLQALKRWIEQQPHLKARTDDQFLVQFLRGCKFSLEKAKKKLDYFYACQTKFPHLYRTTDVDDPKFRDKHNVGYMTVLPTPLNDCGPRIVMLRVIHDTDKFSLEDIVEPCFAMHELLMLNDPYACIYGTMYVMDLAQATFSHLLQATPSLAKKLFTYCIRAMPLRIRTIWFIGVRTEAVKVIEMFLALLPEKLRRMTFICGRNIDSLESHIPLKYLPQDYGGGNGCLQELNDDYHNVWDKHREYFKQNSEYGTDERLRQGKPIDFDDLFGMCGAFRKLEVD